MKKLVLTSMMTLATIAGNAFAADKCETTIKSGVDAAGNPNPMAFNVSKIEIPKTCKQFKITLQNETGLPRATFGHNVVISKASDMPAIGNEGIQAGLDNDYVKKNDPKVIAATVMIGDKDSTSLTLEVSKLNAATPYKFFCTFPGHIAMMQGDVVLVEGGSKS